MYVHQEFPKWKYHATKEACTVKNAAEESALGHAWVDSPAHIESALIENANESVESKIEQVLSKKPSKRAKA